MTEIPPRRAADPVRAPLAEVRRVLLRLHKALIDSERARFEASRGPIDNVQLLTALLEDPHFQWLRPYSRLIAAMDEVIFSREPTPAADARALVAEARGLVAAADNEAEEADDDDPYRAAVRRDPAVLRLHTELTRRIAAALLAYEDAA
jgi:hypothetical protein